MTIPLFELPEPRPEAVSDSTADLIRPARQLPARPCFLEVTYWPGGVLTRHRAVETVTVVGGVL